MQLSLTNPKDLKLAGLGGLTIVGTFILGQATKNFLMADRTKADGTVVKALIPDKWYTNLAGVAIGMVGFIAASQLVKNADHKLLLQLASITLAGYFALRTITKAGETLNGLNGFGGVKEFITKYVPNLGSYQDNGNYASPFPGINLGAAEDLPALQEMMGPGAGMPVMAPANNAAAPAAPAGNKRQNTGSWA